jgi:hypothetical protein
LFQKSPRKGVSEAKVWIEICSKNFNENIFLKETQKGSSAANFWLGYLMLKKSFEVRRFEKALHL